MIHRSGSGSDGAAVESGGGISRRIAVIVSAPVSRWNGRTPEASSYSITPNEN